MNIIANNIQTIIISIKNYLHFIYFQIKITEITNDKKFREENRSIQMNEL